MKKPKVSFKYEIIDYSLLQQHPEYVSDPIVSPASPNLPLLRKEVEWVEAESARQDVDEKPGDISWDQGSWLSVRSHQVNEQTTMCQTGCCLAGNVALNLGTPIFDVNGFTVDYVRGDDGKIYTVRDFARKELGLNNFEAEAMFSGSNTAEDIRQIADSVAARAGERL